MFVVRFGSYAFKIEGRAISFVRENVESQLDQIEREMMSNFEQLQSVLSDLTAAVDEQANVIQAVDQQLEELEAAVADNEQVQPLVAQLRSQVDELKGNTDRLSAAASTAQDTPEPTPEPAPADDQEAPVSDSPQDNEEVSGENTGDAIGTAEPVTDDNNNIVAPSTVEGGTDEPAADVTSDAGVSIDEITEEEETPNNQAQ